MTTRKTNFAAARGKDATGQHGVRIVTSLAVAVLLFAACAHNPKVETQETPRADFNRYHTFALMPLPTSSPVSDPGRASRLAEPVRQTVVAALTAKGLTEVDRSQADIAINLRGESLPKEDVTTWGYLPLPPGRSGLGERAGGNRFRGETVTSFEARTLTIEIFDNRTKDIAWIGRATTEDTDELKVEKVQQAIQRILSQFPAGSNHP